MRSFKILAAGAIFTALAIGTTLPASAQDESSAVVAKVTDTAHTQLRALHGRAFAALKAKDASALMAELDDEIVFTAMNNELVNGKPAALEYYERMMSGSSSIVQDLDLTLDPDIESKIHNDGHTAISAGTSIATLKLRGGLEFTAPLRWSAALVKDDEAWKIASVHYSGDIFENPIDAGVSKYLKLFLSLAAFAGLIIGWFIGRRRRR